MQSNYTIINRHGFVLLMSIFLILGFAVLGMASLSLMGSRVDIALRNLNSVQAYYIAEGGRQYFLEYVINWDTDFRNINNSNPDITRTLGNGTFSITYLTNPARTERTATVRFRATIASPQGDITRSLSQEFDGHEYTGGFPAADDLPQNLQKYCAYFGIPTPDFIRLNGRFFDDAYFYFETPSNNHWISGNFGSQDVPSALYVRGNATVNPDIRFYGYRTNPDLDNLCVSGNVENNCWQLFGNIKSAGNVRNALGVIRGSIHTSGNFTNVTSVPKYSSVIEDTGYDYPNILYVRGSVTNPQFSVIGDDSQDELHYCGTLTNSGTINATRFEDNPPSSDPLYNPYGADGSDFPPVPIKPSINTSTDSYFARELSIAEGIGTTYPVNPSQGFHSIAGTLTLQPSDLSVGRNIYVQGGQVILQGDFTNTPPVNVVISSPAGSGVFAWMQVAAGSNIGTRISLIAKDCIVISDNVKAGGTWNAGTSSFNEDEGCLLYVAGNTLSYVAITLHDQAKVKGRLIMPANPGSNKRNVIALRFIDSDSYATSWGLIYTQSISSPFGTSYGSLFTDARPRTVTWGSPPTYGADASNLTNITAYNNKPSVTQSLIPLCVKGLYDITRRNLREE